MGLKMTTAELHRFLERDFPQVAGDFRIESLAEDMLSLRLVIGEKHLRPGGTVSGPAIFALADVAVYLALLAMIGPRALAVTTGGSVDFLRKPQPGRDLVAQARLIKRGRVLVVGDVLVHSGDDPAPVARATLTYSIPPARAGGGAGAD